MTYGQIAILMCYGTWLQINNLLEVLLLLSVEIQEFKLPSHMLEGLFLKACQALLSPGLAPNNQATWNLLVSKHPKSPLLSPPSAPLLLPPDFDLKAILHSFPKGTACVPSGLRIQHLIEVAGIPMQSPICAALRDIVNLLSQDCQFKKLFDSFTPIERACLLSISSPHASAWLSVIPSPSMGLHLEPSEFQVAIKWWLGIPVAQGQSCSQCNATLDAWTTIKTG